MIMSPSESLIWGKRRKAILDKKKNSQKVKGWMIDDPQPKPILGGPLQ